MKQIFTPRGYFTVPDRTQVSPFLNATDTTQTDVPWQGLGDMSLAAGRVEPGVHSWIHQHPVVTQVTYLVSGQLTIWMQGPKDMEPYDLSLNPGDAVLCQPQTLFQLRNDGKEVATLLYMVSPSYVFEMADENILYDDASMVAKSWEELQAMPQEGKAPTLSTYEQNARRTESLRRLAVNKGQRPQSLAEESITPLTEDYTYLAPDGSEIRLLASGEHGGFAHCVLPKGRVSAPVKHRTVEELWYVVSGCGEIWRARGKDERVDSIGPGDSMRIPVDVSFQFRAGAGEDLTLLLSTMPPWPGEKDGPNEAVPAQGHWQPS